MIERRPASGAPAMRRTATSRTATAVAANPGALSSRPVSPEAIRFAAIRRDNAQSQARTRWTMTTSVIFHAVLIALLALLPDVIPTIQPITEITLLTPADLLPPPPPQPVASPDKAPAGLPEASRRAPAPAHQPTPQAAPRVAAPPPIAAPPRGDQGRARAREVASAVRAGDLLKGIDAMVSDAGERKPAGSTDRAAIAHSQARAAADRAGVIAGSAGGEAGGEAIEQTARGAGGHTTSAPLARDAVVVGDLTQVEGGGGEGGEGGQSGERTTESLMAVVHRYAGGIKYCYDQVLSARPATHGRLVLLITVAGNGAVSRAQIAADTVKDDELEGCVLGQVRGWKFPRSTSSQAVSFRCPLVFTPPE